MRKKKSDFRLSITLTCKSEKIILISSPQRVHFSVPGQFCRHFFSLTTWHIAKFLCCYQQLWRGFFMNLHPPNTVELKFDKFMFGGNFIVHPLASYYNNSPHFTIHPSSSYSSSPELPFFPQHLMLFPVPSTAVFIPHRKLFMIREKIKLYRD